MQSTAIEMTGLNEQCELLVTNNKDNGTKVSISWHDISVSTKITKNLCCRPSKSTKLLKSVSGRIDSGQMLAVMGPSGSGKSTLLNVLTGRNLSQFDINGTVLINDNPFRIDMMKSLSGYVQQGSLFVPMLTVKEYLVFQSLLRMDRSNTYEQRSKRIEEVIAELGLSKCASSRIGNRYDDLVGSGISGGELRRLAFAAEILTNPPILICDEPTSGLDSYLAESVVKILQKMAHSGRTVVCTIHQPSSEVFILFDLMLLLTDGRLAFMGTLDQAQQHFSSLGLHCPVNFNPADHYLKQVSVVPGLENECQQRIETICGSFNEKNFLPNGTKTNAASPTLGNELTYSSKVELYKASWWDQFRALLWRSFLTNSREPMITRIKLTQTITVALLLGIVYWDQQLNQKGIMNLNGAIFILIINLTFMNIFSVINTFCSELSIFLREHNDGMYRVDTYFLSKMSAELPFQIFMPTILVILLYHMIGFNSSMGSYVTFIFISILVANCGISFGYMISCISSSPKMAIALSSPLILPLLLFGGFFINSTTIPIYFELFKYISWFYYGNEALVIAQWKNIENISCAQEKQDNSTNKPFVEQRCLTRGLSVIDELGFEASNLQYDIYSLTALIIIMRVIAFVALLLKSKRH